MNCCCSKRDRALELLNQWKIEMYASNRFLYVIPEERIRNQYKIIKEQLNANSWYSNLLSLINNFFGSISCSRY